MFLRHTAFYVISAIVVAFLHLNAFKWLRKEESVEFIPEIFTITGVKDAICFKFQCCDAYVRYLEDILVKLKDNFNDKLHGQKIAGEAIISCIEEKFANVSEGLPLVIELYGPQGTGKSFTCELIAKSIFTKGMSTPLVHEFSGEDMQLPEEQLANYQDHLENWIVGNLTLCIKSMFIFKHTVKIPEALMDIIQSILNLQMGGIFIFTTTEKGPIISELYYHQLKHGYKKKYMKAVQFQAAEIKSSFNTTGKAMFLPMEVKDLKYCMLDEFHRLRYYVPSQCTMDAVYQTIKVDQYGYTETSCKDIVEQTRYVSEFGRC